MNTPYDQQIAAISSDGGSMRYGSSCGQIMTKATTQSGKRGWFTGRMLAWPLSEEEYNQPDSWHRQEANRRGWVYLTSSELADHNNRR